MSKFLFILKRREDYNCVLHTNLGLSTGLFNSANFVNSMLQKADIDSHVVVVTDNNDIDREVAQYKPTHVIIEALWVVPEKFDILQKLHPSVKWVIRLHSDIPFIANETIAMNWLSKYSGFKNVFIACNSRRIERQLQLFFQIRNGWSRRKAETRVLYLPNYYPETYIKKSHCSTRDVIHIGCFGAIRPLKNTLMQAFAALEYAKQEGKLLHFHINSGRIEMKGDGVFKNLVDMFEQLAGAGHRLITHDWMCREDFIKLCHTMDIGMQVSFSETFNIVAADFVSQGVPIVTSPEVPWANRLFSCETTNHEDIVRSLRLAHKFPSINVFLNQRNLKKYSKQTISHWISYAQEN